MEQSYPLNDTVTVQYWNYGRVLEPTRTFLEGVGQTYMSQELGG